MSLMQINLVRKIELGLTPALLESLSQKFGLPAHILGQVAGRAIPVIVASIMSAGVTEAGVRKLYSAVLAREIHARVWDTFTTLIDSSEGLKALEDAGQTFLREASTLSPAQAGDIVSAQTGLPSQAAYAMTCVMAAILAGLLKQTILLDEVEAEELPQLLAGEWTSIEPGMTDLLLRSLKLQDKEAFQDMVTARLRVLSASLRRDRAMRGDELRLHAPASSVSMRGPVPATEELRAPSRQRPPLLAIVLIMLVTLGTIVYGIKQLHPEWLNLMKSPDSRSTESRQKQALALASTVVPAQQVLSSAPALAFNKDGATSVPGGTSTAWPLGPASEAASSPTEANALPSAVVATVAGAASEADGPFTAPERATVPTGDVLKKPSPSLSFGVNRVGAPNVIATLGSAAEKAQVMDLLERKLGAHRYTAQIDVDPRVGVTPWLRLVSALVPLMRVPRADLTIEAQTIELGGAARQTGENWVGRVRKIFGERYQVRTFDPAQTVLAATAAFRKAAASAQRSGDCESVVKVLNLQIVDFAQGSAQVPVSALENMEKSAQLVRACGSKIGSLTVQSYADSVGEVAMNLPLTEKRADAVREALVRLGVAPNMLKAVGFGAFNPITSNSTERGRFANRRIVFVER